MFDFCFFVCYNLFKFKKEIVVRLYIAMGIVLELLQHKKVTADRLAEKFEISTRTVYRYVDDLSIGGFPVISFLGRGGGLGLAENFSLNNLYFSKQELDLLLYMCKNQKNKTAQIKTLCDKLEYIKMNKYS